MVAVNYLRYLLTVGRFLLILVYFKGNIMILANIIHSLNDYLLHVKNENIACGLASFISFVL